MYDQLLITALRDRIDLSERASKWFHDKWKVPQSAYLESIQECQKKQIKTPQWYLVLDQDEIIGNCAALT